MDDRIWILFARRVSGEITPEEQQELEALIREQPERAYFMEIVLKYFNGNAKTDEQVERRMSDMRWRNE
jgi:hypothetical protein